MFNAVIDELTRTNQLQVGPDFTAYFMAHPDQLHGHGPPATTRAEGDERALGRRHARRVSVAMTRATLMLLARCRRARGRLRRRSGLRSIRSTRRPIQARPTGRAACTSSGNQIQDGAGHTRRPARREPLGHRVQVRPERQRDVRRSRDRGLRPGDHHLAERQHRARSRSTNRAGWGSTARPNCCRASTTRPRSRTTSLRLHKYDLIPILELHWVGPGTTLADPPAADARRRSRARVLGRRRDDVPRRRRRRARAVQRAVPGRQPGQRRRLGCAGATAASPTSRSPSGAPATTYQAAGMQSIVDAIRDDRLDARHPAGRHPVLERADAVAGAQAERSARTSWAPPGTSTTSTRACRRPAGTSRPAAVAAAVPLVATEIGQNDCMGDVRHAADGVAGRSRARATSPGRGTRSARAAGAAPGTAAASPGR